MEKGCYEINVSRTLTDANYNTYISGALHPDRIMKEHDLIYLLEGEWVIRQGNMRYTMTPDDVLILHAGEHHHGDTLCAPGTKTMYLHIKAAANDRFNLHTDQESKLPCELPALVSCGADSAVKKLFRELISVWHEVPSPFAECRISAMINLLLCRLYKCAGMSASYERKPYLVAEAVRLMEETPERFLSLSDMTEMLSVSVKTLNRKFHQIYNMSAYQYQMNLKLDNVRAFLIHNPHIKLKAVAMNFGFYDEFYMSRQFRLKFGISPGEARMKLPQTGR